MTITETLAPESIAADVNAVLGGYDTLTAYLTAAGCPTPTHPAALRSVLTAALRYADDLAAADEIDVETADLIDRIHTAVDTIDRVVARTAETRATRLADQILDLADGPGIYDVAYQIAVDIVAHTPGVDVYADDGCRYRYQPNRGHRGWDFISVDEDGSTENGWDQYRGRLGVNLRFAP